MKILSWNVQSLGNTRTSLKKILQTHRPQIVFLYETKMLPMRMNNVRVELNFENCFTVSRNRLERGLAMLWSSNIDVNIASYSQHHIDAEIFNEGGPKWRCTRVYGHPKTTQKRHTWTVMKRLASLSSLPWLCFGDFTEILHLSKKKRDNIRDANMISEFRDAIKECSLADLGCK